MANRYQDDLKKIVGLDEDNKGLESAEQRDPLPSKRGIAYFDGLTGAVSSLTGAGGSVGSSPPPSTSPVNEATANSGAWQTGSVSDGYPGGTTQPRNPLDWETGVQYENAGVYDAAGILDGTVGPFPFDTLQSFSDFSGNSGAIRGLTGLKDCNDNQDIKIFFGGYTGGQGFPPPNEDWVDAETPPTTTDPTWQSGYYWVSVWAFATPQATPRQAAQEIEAGVANREFKDFTPAYSPTATSLTANFWILPAKTSTQGFGMTRYSCPSLPSYPGDPEACVSEAPDDPFDAAETEWPSDNTLSLKWDGSKFTTSEYEGDIPTNWNQTNSSTLSFCMDGGRYGKLEPAGDGGLLIYETSTQGGDPIAGSFYKHFSPSGALLDVGDVANLAVVRPHS